MASATGDTDRGAHVLRTLCAEMVRTATPGAAVAIATPHGPPIELAAGIRCSGKPDGVVVDTPFRIGSVTKSLTAAAVVRRAAAGHFALDDGVVEHLPGLAATFSTITWRDLLDHTAGLPDTPPSAATAKLSGAALVAALTAARPIAPRGEAYLYANAGYVLLGMALERQARTQSTELVRAAASPSNAVSEPRVSITAEEHGPATASCGHLGTEPFSIQDDLRLFAHGATWTFPAGGAVLSAPALARAGQRIATDPPPPNGPPADGTYRYAHGLQRRALSGGEQHWLHAGQTGDFSAELHILPKSGVVVAVLANAGVHLRATAFAALAHAAPEIDLRPLATASPPVPSDP